MSTGPFLTPADVSPENAKLVLDFLNAATSAQQLASAIEIPGELDIGERLAQRILSRRAQLGGTFTTLQQVADIPLIGPERFTEIVTALSPQKVPGALPTPLEQLREEVAQLRQLIQSGLGGPTVKRRLTLTPVEPHVFLGQPMTVVATLLDDDQPVVDASITFVATRGEMKANDGYQAHSGHLITARTGLDGTVRLTLQAMPKEELTPLQREALSAMLALLEPKAATPQDTAAGFQTLAQQYAWEVNLPFRQAVDIFVRDFQPMWLDTINLRDALSEWIFYHAAVLAFVAADTNGGNGSGVTATATLHTRAKDWIQPFLQTFIDLTRAQNTLTGELRDISRTETDTGRLVTAVYDRAGKYVSAQHGRVGAYVGRKVAETSIRNFLDTELQNMPLDARIDVFPALDVASKTLATTDVSVIRGLVGTRNDISKEVEKKTRPTVDLGGLFDRLNGLEATVALVPSRADHTNLRNELLGAVATARTDLTNALATRVTQAELTSALATRVTQTELTTALATRVTQAELTTALATRVTQAELNTALASRVTQTELNTALASRVTKDEMNTALATRVTQTELNTALATRVTQTELSTALATRVTQTELSTALATRVTQTELNTALASRVTKTELTSALANRVTKDELNNALIGRVTLNELNTALAGTVTRADLDTALAGKLDRTTFTTFNRNLDLRFTAVDTKINDLRR